MFTLEDARHAWEASAGEIAPSLLRPLEFLDLPVHPALLQIRGIGSWVLAENTRTFCDHRATSGTAAMLWAAREDPSKAAVVWLGAVAARLMSRDMSDSWRVRTLDIAVRLRQVTDEAGCFWPPGTRRPLPVHLIDGDFMSAGGRSAASIGLDDVARIAAVDAALSMATWRLAHLVG